MRAQRAQEGTCARSGLDCMCGTEWVGLLSTPGCLALRLLRRRAGRDRRSRPEQRVRGGGAEVPVARERMQMQMWSAACRHMLHGSRQGLWVSVLHASG